MQKRLFVAISLPEDIKKRLFRFVQKEYKDLPVRWGRSENYHITLNFLGYIQGERIPEICDRLEKVAGQIEAATLDFSRVEPGPKKDSPKLIWAAGEKSEAMAALKNKLDEYLGMYFRDRKGFAPHITLGRIKKRDWQKLEQEPEIERDFKFSVPVNSIELYESMFEKGKRAYYALESFPLE